MGEYLLNKETQKIELHFDKSEYLALSEEQKKEIKSNFLWSRTAGAWVSRSKNSHYHPIQIAKKLNLTDAGTTGERLSYEEELERKAERAEARADRYEQYSENAEARGQNLQATFNNYRKDWSWLTQPIIQGHAGSRAFANHRNKVMARYDRGFEEYRKSEYFKDRAETARATADKKQLNDPIYLHNRIKECKSIINKLQKNLNEYESKLTRIENGETLTNYKGETVSAATYESYITETLERLEYEIDKEAFMQNCLDEIGGNKFSKDNIKPGYIVKVRRWGIVEVTGTGPVNFTYNHKLGNNENWPGQDPYAAIIEIVEAKETKQEIENPYKIGDILCRHYGMDTSNAVYQAYQVVKVTKTGVKLQQIAIENRKPIKDSFISDKQTQKKIVKSKWSEYIGVYMDDWPLYKYTEKAETAAL